LQEDEKANIPRFACMMLDDKEIKQEDVEYDLSKENLARHDESYVLRDSPPLKRKEREVEKEFLRNWYDDKNHDPDSVSLGSYGGEDVEIDNWSWYVSKSLYSHNANNEKALGTNCIRDSNISIYDVYNIRHTINVALKSVREIYKTNETNWLLDGGASLHVTPYMSDFSKYYSYSQPELISTANKNAKAKLLGKGIVYIQYNIGSKKRIMKLEVCYMLSCLEQLLSTGSLKMCGYTESSDKNDTKFYLNGKLELIGHPR
jgi:hypothetical protein